MTVRPILRAAAAGAFLAAVAACGGDKGGAAMTAATSTDRVLVKDFRFQPGDITVKPGTTVTWTFEDEAAHTVASTTGGTEIPESPELAGGTTFTHQFGTPGTYAYFCTLHNYMTGTVVVSA